MSASVVAADDDAPPHQPSVWQRLHGPDDMVEANRWLFLGMSYVSLLVSIVGPLAAPENTIPLLAIAAAVVLVVSWTLAYHLRTAPFVLDLVDFIAIAAFALSCTEPTATFGIIFGALWFKSLYGSARRALLRCTMYAGALLLGLVAWSSMPGYPPPYTAPLAGAVPLMFVTLAVGRRLADTMRARSEAARRSEVQALMGLRLLAVSEAADIYQVAWAAADGLCDATPGLRVMLVVGSESALRVEGSAGFARRPATAAPDLLALPPAAGLGRIQDVGRSPELDASAGETCAWVCLPLPVLRNVDDHAWMLIGAPKRVPPEAVVSLTSLANQVSLAMINGQTHRALTEQATLDGLTQLANRTSFQAATVAALAALPSGETTVLFVDLDDFKDINDLFGHAAGDEVLCEVAARLRRATRPTDLCARLGGDEFAVLLRNTGLGVATEVAHRIVASVSAPAQLKVGMGHVGASVGVAIAAHDTPLEDLIHRADVAMYAAKANGKGRVQVFEPGLLQPDTALVTLERQLAGAVRNGEITVHYQPIVSLPEGRCSGVEALARWQHPDGGLVYPGDFLGVAERTGAIRGIGGHVLRQACSDAIAWRLAGTPLSVHVNVSAVQLDDDDFVASVVRCLSDSGLPAEDLVLEVTETVTLSCTVTIDRLTTLADLGVTIAIDDFGTGYSALTTLRTLPVRLVKIDRSFVAGSTLNDGDRAVTEAVVTMATQLGLQTVGEGVERPEQEAFLQSIGATFAQGYLYLRPSTAEEFGSWLATNRAGRTAEPADDVVVPFAAVAGRFG